MIQPNYTISRGRYGQTTIQKKVGQIASLCRGQAAGDAGLRLGRADVLGLATLDGGDAAVDTLGDAGDVVGGLDVDVRDAQGVVYYRKGRQGRLAILYPTNKGEAPLKVWQEEEEGGFIGRR